MGMTTPASPSTTIVADTLVTMLPNTQLGTIVSFLEMHEPPQQPSEPVRSALKLERWNPVDMDRYLALFRLIGAPWLWCGRLLIAPDDLARLLASPDTAVWAATRRDGTPVGLLELDFSVPHQTELSYFGLAPGMTGHGHGGWLMAHALRHAWRADTRRVWVHTCTNDDPRALGFYQRQGFTLYARALEAMPDPRVLGLYPHDVAPHIPLLV
jgi:GNAT superfamily N-acetyltransferase